MFGDKLFDIVLGKKDDTERKPSPMGALIIAKAFELRPTEIIYMGDTNTDMMTGKNAGMFTVGVTWGFREREELEKNGADKIIDKPNEILDLL
ncbi:MAG: HAD family hydrolase, partial [Firmicutes bacterium]|nr:HAD family hydrolase [Bacillota bacterium]